MKIRFQADADLKIAIVNGVRLQEPSIEFQTADEAGIRGLSDPQVLEYCARENRVLVSHDRRTMPKHFGDFLKTQTSPGVIIIGQNVSLRSAIDALLLHWWVVEADEFRSSITDLP